MKENRELDLKKLHLFFLFGLLSYFVLSVVVKLCGLDLFTITDTIEPLKSFSDFIGKTLWLQCIFMTMSFMSQTSIVVSISGERFDVKRMIVLMLITTPIIYFINMIITTFNFFPSIFATVIPVVLSIIFSKDKSFSGIVCTIIRAVVFLILFALLQELLLYLRVNVLSCNYHSENIFNVILLNIDFFVVQLFVWSVCKIRHKED
jgi:hypothetical protein